MAKARLVVLTNPTSPEQEDAYNRWYNEVHAREVVALPGFTGMTRFRALGQVAPRTDRPLYRYLAIYEMADAELALASLRDGVAGMDLSGPIDLEGALAISYEAFFTYDKAP